MIYEIKLSLGTKLEETIYADSYKYNEKEDTYTYHVVKSLHESTPSTEPNSQ